MQPACILFLFSLTLTLIIIIIIIIMGKAPSSSTHKAVKKSSPTKISPSQQRALNAIAALMARKDEESVPRSEVMAVVGCKNKNSINILLSGLKKHHECISYPDKDTVTLTDVGRALADANDDSLETDNGALLEKAKSEIKGKKARQLFEILSDGGKRSRKDCATQLGYDDPKKMASMMSTMKKDGALCYCTTDDGEPGLMLPDQLFPFGRGGH